MLNDRLAPEHPFPAAIEDAAAAIELLRGQGQAARNLAIVGDSAGDGLTLATALALRDRAVPALAGLVLLSPWFDLSNTHASYEQVGARDLILTKADLDRHAAYDLNGADPRDPRASPFAAALHDLPAMLVQVGAGALLIGEARDCAARAKAEGGAVELEIWPEMSHVFQAFAVWLPEARDAITRIGAWLQARWAERITQENDAGIAPRRRFTCRCRCRGWADAQTHRVSTVRRLG